jgi:hypothetical protein
VKPTSVFAQDRLANVDEGIDDHALWVASVIISSQTAVENDPPGRSPPIGVAPEAALYSSAFIVEPVGLLQESAAISAQLLAPSVFATNMSFGLELDDSSSVLDGSSTLTAFIDWSTREHNLLYVVAGNELVPIPGAVPTDNFNGITVASSKKDANGTYRIIESGNVFDDSVDAFGDRTSTTIVAPGFLMDVAGENGGQPARGDSTGTSFAAPHVTGTLALLTERAGSSTRAQQHLTKKAVLLNSADKIKGIISMERTVEKTNGSTWLGSTADTDPMIPLDRQMGVGHLNAKRAIDQLDGGRHGQGGVPNIGWDFDTFIDQFADNRYTVTLNKGDYVSATLVWDREVLLNSFSTEYQRGDTFQDIFFEDLNLYLVPAGGAIGTAIKASTSTEWNLEHIFASVNAQGQYDIVVHSPGFGFINVPYAIAWWAGADTRQGDNNSDGRVDGADYVLWRNDSDNYGGSPDGYNTWRANFGSTFGSGSGSASVPEPSTLVLMGACFAGVLVTRRRHSARTPSL